MHVVRYWYLNRIKIVIIYKNFFSTYDFVLQNIFKSFINRMEPELEPEPQLRNYGSGSRRQFNFGSSALGSASLLHFTPSPTDQELFIFCAFMAR
jgi:hypothetical protein